jgi:hypothetical protein
MNTKLKFAFEKETKGAVRYQEVGEDGAPAFAPRSVHSTCAKAQCRAAKSRKHLLLLSRANNLISDPSRRDREAVESHAVHGRRSARPAGYLSPFSRLRPSHSREGSGSRSADFNAPATRSRSQHRQMVVAAFSRRASSSRRCFHSFEKGLKYWNLLGTLPVDVSL